MAAATAAGDGFTDPMPMALQIDVPSICVNKACYRDTSQVRSTSSVAPYSSPVPRDLW